jgi:hypothetical protein
MKMQMLSLSIIFQNFFSIFPGILLPATLRLATGGLRVASGGVKGGLKGLQVASRGRLWPQTVERGFLRGSRGVTSGVVGGLRGSRVSSVGSQVASGVGSGHWGIAVGHKKVTGGLRRVMQSRTGREIPGVPHSSAFMPLELSRALWSDKIYFIRARERDKRMLSISLDSDSVMPQSEIFYLLCRHGKLVSTL